MTSRTIAAFSLLILLIATQYGCGIVRLAEAGKRRIHITDDLDDVVDDEEDEAWKEWGKKKQQPEFDPPPDFSNMDPDQIQQEMMSRQFGPVFGFVKLSLATRRTKETVGEIARRWTNLARTGAIEARFTGIDLSTVMFNMDKGQDTLELKEFLLSQPEAYEVKIGDQLFRRPGDPPFEEVYEKYHGRKYVADDTEADEVDKDQKDEL